MSISDQDRSDLIAAAEARVFARLREAVLKQMKVTGAQKAYLPNYAHLLCIFADPPQAEKAKSKTREELLAVCRTWKLTDKEIREIDGSANPQQPSPMTCGFTCPTHGPRYETFCTLCAQAKPPEQPAVSEGKMTLLEAIREVLPALPDGTYCQCQGERCSYCRAVTLLAAASEGK